MTTTTAAVTVIAHYQSHPAAGDEVDAILARHVTATPAEPGCIVFSAYRDQDDPDRFTLHEEYASEQAFQELRQTAHFARYIEGQVAPLLRDRHWRRYRQIPPAGAARQRPQR